MKKIIKLLTFIIFTALAILSIKEHTLSKVSSKSSKPSEVLLAGGNGGV